MSVFDFSLQVGVKIFLQNEEGKYLLLHRNKEKYPEVQTPWDIVGGRIDPGIPLLQNLSREAREETNLDLQGELQLISAQDIIRVDKHVVRLTYVGRAAGEIKISPEHDMYKWYSVEEMKNLEGMDSFAKELLNKI